MGGTLRDRLVIGVSTRALFDLEAANAVFEKDGLAAYRAYQLAHEKDPLGPGTAFPLIRDLLAINGRSPDGPLIEVVILSRNHADSAMRVFNSIEELQLSITRGVFRGGRDPWPFLLTFHCELFLSAEPSAVQAAINAGVPAALVLRPPAVGHDEEDEVRIAFDGDSVLFDEESDRIWRAEGADAFFKHERDNADVPLSAGPFQPFLAALARVQAKFPEDASPIRTALVTARNAPAHIRVINTFRAWNTRIDEVYFLGDVDKVDALTHLRPHIFLDDRRENLERAADEVPSAHVPARGDQLQLFEPSAVPARPRRRARAGEPSAKSKPTRKAAAPARERSAPGVQPAIRDHREAVRPSDGRPEVAAVPAERARAQ